MNLILTMAGNYSRFINEGYKTPKYLLPWSNHTILSEILLQMTKDSVLKNIFLIANRNDLNFIPHVIKTMGFYGINKSNLILVNDTTSQCETALMAIQEISHNNKLVGPVFFHNVDTILYDRKYSEINDLLLKYDGYIDIFTSNNHEYSYVVKDGLFVKDIQEKILISEIASSGFYGFSSADTFIKNYENNYFSKMYNSMILNKQIIVCGPGYDENNTIVLGTPSEYFSLSKKLNF